MPDDAAILRFTQRLKQYRQAAGLNQEQLGAEVAHVEGRSAPYTQGAVAGWESPDDYPKVPERVFAIEQVLKVEPGALSSALGYIPAGAQPAVTVPDAISADTGLSPEQREDLIAQWEGMRRRTADRRQKRRPPAGR